MPPSLIFDSGRRSQTIGQDRINLTAGEHRIVTPGDNHLGRWIKRCLESTDRLDHPRLRWIRHPNSNNRLQKQTKTVCRDHVVLDLRR